MKEFAALVKIYGHRIWKLNGVLGGSDHNLLGTL